MTNFSINFSNPWLLLLLIPAFLLTFIPYFRMNKRYRGTRNRIVSMVLHLIIMTLAISLLAGITFEYDLPNDENEVILLVDTSYSGSELEDEKDAFIQSVMSTNKNGTFKLGIVTFGFDQVYALELTSNMQDAYSKYMSVSAEQPVNDSATDIEAALKYAAGLFSNPNNGRIVLMTDAIETDGAALNAIKAVASSGVKVDTVDFTDGKRGDEVQIIDMIRPESKIKFNEEFYIELTLQSSYVGDAILKVYNDGTLCSDAIEVDLIRGLTNVKVPITFETANPNNLHKLSFELTSNNDTLDLNNTFHSYILVESFNKILILESIDGESSAIERMLGPDFDITTINIDDTNNVPMTVDNMRLYDQVILCNVSYSQMPEGFEKVLYDYVVEIGGGLFTVCGNEAGTDDANAFTKEDMKPSQYLKKLLPVDIINFTPPVAVIILIDKSGSMYSPDFDVDFEHSKLYYALQGAEACLDLLSDRDYIGVYELDDYGEEALELTPATERTKVLNAIQNIGLDGGGTVFSTALSAAGKTLREQHDVEKKHIIIITDGEPDPSNVDLTREVMIDNAAAGITTSIIGIQCATNAQILMKQLLEECGGPDVTEDNFHNVTANESVPNAVRDDMGAKNITEVNYEEFQIELGVTSDINKIVINDQIDYIKQEDMPTLDGFYGMKAKDADGDRNDLTKDLKVLLNGPYTPIYTQWTYGKGKVGTFGCDLNGTWSSGFIDTPEGEAILKNIITALMPEENIRLETINAEFEGDNYKTQLNVFTKLEGEEYVEVTVTSPSADGISASTTQIFTAGVNDDYSVFYFDVITPGVHEIVVKKKDVVGRDLGEKVLYKAIGYSKEYDMFYDNEAAESLIVEIADRGHGELIDSPYQVYESASQYMHKIINPLIVFLIIILSFFLLDIAVRKFKWKWIHELIRDKKAKQAIAQNTK